MINVFLVLDTVNLGGVEIAISKLSLIYDKVSMYKILEDSILRNHSYYKLGRAASYIPMLASANLEEVGVAITNMRGEDLYVGDYSKKFTMQSISKVIALILGLIDNGEEYVFSRVSTESPNEPFNTIETSPFKLDNPMTNAGAITICSMIKGKSLSEKISRILHLTRKLSGNNDIEINQEVYISEKNTGNRNKAIAYLLKDNKKIEGEVLEVLDLYFMQCSIEVNVVDLSNIAAVIANNGVNPKTKEIIVSKKIAQLVKAIMVIFGMYNESGHFLMKVGIPAKSGVGGGIMAVAPNNIGVGIYSPSLDDNGNSIVGMKILEDITDMLDLNILG